MKKVENFIPQMTIEEFANKHNLKMCIHERELPIGHPDRFYAEFENVEIKDGCILMGTFGNGHTPEQAIEDYKKKINLKLLIVDAYGSRRKEIKPVRIVEES